MNKRDKGAKGWGLNEGDNHEKRWLSERDIRGKEGEREVPRGYGGLDARMPNPYDCT